MGSRITQKRIGKIKTEAKSVKDKFERYMEHIRTYTVMYVAIIQTIMALHLMGII